jgi:glycosyltransferase involved in cell wall biosynthesis
MPKLSIITINFNNAAGLSKTIKSVIEQTFTDFEYLVIDGASSDGSLNIINENADKITYWISEPDKGIYNAMNKGILKSNGEFLLFLNSGDYLTEQTVLEKVFAIDKDCDLLYGNIILVSKNGNKKKDVGPGGGKISLLNFRYNTICHQSSFINRRLFNKYGLYDEELKIVSDWKFLLTALVLNTAIVVYKNIDVAYYKLDGISATQIEVLESEREKVLLELIPVSILNDIKELEFDWVRIKRIREYKLTTLLFRLSQILLIRISILIKILRTFFHIDNR